MNQRERLETVFAGGDPDRTPILGGWIACPDHICEVAQVSLDEYWEDPFNVSVRAYEILGMDGLVSLFVPASREDFRCVNIDSYAHAKSEMSLEEAIAHIDQMPSPEAIEEEFDFDTVYADFKRDLIEKQALCGDMVWMPASWGSGARVTWYGTLGYENFFMIVAGHEDRARKLMEVGGANGRCQSRQIAQAVADGIYPHAVLLGEDICTQRGPMISPSFMEQYYAPELKRGLEPLLEVGCKPVWHSDGDVRPMMDLLLDSGVQGLQGFQPECGLDIDYVSALRTREGEPLLIFGPLAVTTELPCCTPDEIRAKVHHAIEVCKGNANLVLFTGNTINPDIPLENIRAMYNAVLEG